MTQIKDLPKVWNRNLSISLDSGIKEFQTLILFFKFFFI
jgi:hypothetical protein